MAAESLGVNENIEVYYGGTYWNDLEAVRRRINERIAGDPSEPWYHHFAHDVGRRFERALILNCGDGWVERDLVQHGLIAEGVGTDYSEELLDRARQSARDAGLPLSYGQGNINTGAFPPGAFDLVVNHAAAHHITAIDRVLRQVCRVLPSDGWFVNVDYVGPHRNQYRLDAWEEVWRLNQELPPALRQRLEYPLITDWVAVDPTEAVHSELILDTFHRYFTVGEYVALGGAIAYPLLTHNARMFEADDDAERARWVDEILQADDRFLREHPESTLFAYFTGRPDKEALEQAELLAGWEAEEAERERLAAERGGEYYERGPLATALVALDRERLAAEAARAKTARLQAELDDVRSSLLYRQLRRVADSGVTRAVRGNRVVAGLERRLRPKL